MPSSVCAGWPGLVCGLGVVGGGPVDRLVGGGLADDFVFRRIVGLAVPVEEIVEPDLRLRRAALVIPGELALGAAIDQAPTVAAHPFLFEERQVGLPAAALQPRHPFGVDDRAKMTLVVRDLARASPRRLP